MSAAAGRTRLIDGFLAEQGWAAARRLPLPADASFRRYVRLALGSRRALLMDAPPPHEAVAPYMRVADHLRLLGFATPRVLGADVDEGLLLVEDLGDATFTRLLDAGADPEPLYALAVDTLAALHRNRHAGAIPLPPYDTDALLAEARLLVDWWWPAAQGAAMPAATAAEWEAAWHTVLEAHAFAVPRTLVLRDFHVDNLILVEGRAGVAACGLLDFQDALIGPASYDLVSLVEDARRDVAPGLGEAAIERYLGAFPALDRTAWWASMAVLGAQRHAKVIGIFTRLSRRDGKDAYLRHLPRVWRLFERSLAHPALAPVAGWVDRQLPASSRIAPHPLGDAR
jgi:N-acetylmuramate 1-kinase